MHTFISADNKHTENSPISVLAVQQHYSNVTEQLSDQDTGFNVGPHNVTGYIKVDADELALWKNKYLGSIYFFMMCYTDHAL